MQNQHVYIIIVNYLRWQDTRDCIESVLRSTHRDFSIFVIDNNSGNNSLAFLGEWIANNNKDLAVYTISNANDLQAPFSFISLVQNGKNEGFAAANNIVLRLLKNRDVFVWLLNPDMIVQENTLATLLNFAKEQGPECIAGAEVLYAEGNHELLFYGGGKINFFSGTVRPLKNKSSAAKLDYISGACLFTHASAFERGGLLPEKYFLYWEETDWCYHAKKQGMKLQLSLAVCYDKISTTIGKDFLANYYYCRNGLQFVRKYRKRLLPFVFGSVLLRFMKRVITGEWGRARGVWKGSVDFLKGRTNEIQ